MTLDRPACSSSSFGDDTKARPPPSPQKTPTTTVHPSPVFETPKQGQGRFDDVGGCWTPRFAEEYSIFNATPGNLRASPRNGTFPSHFGGAPFSPSLQDEEQLPHLTAGRRNKRRLPAEDIAEEIAAHANHFSPSPNLELPPVDPSRRLLSSSGAPRLTQDQVQGQEANFSSDRSDSQASAARVQRSPKKARREGGTVQGAQGQTVTPPPSSTKSRRKVAPKIDTDAMQNDQGFGDFSGGGQGIQHHNMGVFVTSPGDMFGFPMSAPASANVFVDPQQFWETGAGSMPGMDLNFSTSHHADIFQDPASAAPMGHHRQGASMDWGRTDQMFREPSMLPQQMSQQQPQQQHQHHQQPQQPQQQQPQPQQQGQQQAGRRQSQDNRVSSAKRERPLAPKTMMPTSDASVMEQSMMLNAKMYETAVEDSFGLSHGRSVEPGMLFSRPPSLGIPAVFDPMQHKLPSSSAPPAVSQLSGQQQPQKRPQNNKKTRNARLAPAPLKGLGITTSGSAAAPGELRRSNSAIEPSAATKSDRATASSPIKPRPGLSRSFSESRGKNQLGRPASASGSFPALAPAFGTLSVHPTRPSSKGRSSSGSGRLSPVKAHHQHRLPSLTSIPETSPGSSSAAAMALKGASVKFTIDPNGRARVETVVAEEEHGAFRRGPSLQKPRIASRSSSRWDSTDDDGVDPGHGDSEEYDDASSTDDEPIIIPSRNTSFALPDPLKVSGSRARYDRYSQRSFSEQSSASSLVLPGESLLGGGGSSSNDPESEAETVVNDGSLLLSGAGDAASELEKLRRGRQGSRGSRLTVPGSGGQRQRFTASPGGSLGRGGHQQPQYSSAATSPTTLTEMSLPTPSTATRTGRGIRCVCDNPGVDRSRDGFMVQCESCEMWLHGRCIGIPKKSMMPSVFVCTICSSIARPRAGRSSMPTSALSPLAHKAFAKFR